MKQNKSILKNGLLLVSSGGVGQIVALLLLFIVGRQYNEEMMGTLGIFLSWGGILSIVVTGRYEQAIMIAQTEEEANAIRHLSIGLAFFLSILSFFIFLLIFILFPNQSLGYYILLLPLFIFISSYYTVISLSFLRDKAFRKLSSSQVIRGISNNLLKVIGGFFTVSVSSLIFSAIASPFLALAPLRDKKKKQLQEFATSIRYTKTLFFRYPNKRNSALSIAKKHYKFPKYGILQTLINTLLGSLLVLAMPFQFSQKSIGYLIMAIMLARRPLYIICDNISKVYFKHLGELVIQQASIKKHILKFLFSVLIIGSSTAGILYLFMDKLVIFFVSEKWLFSSFIIKAMLPMLVVNVLTSTLNILPDLLGKQKSNLVSQIIMLLFNIIIIETGFYFFDFGKFISYFYSFMIIEQVFYLCYLLIIVQQYEKQLKK